MVRMLCCSIWFVMLSVPGWWLASSLLCVCCLHSLPDGMTREKVPKRTVNHLLFNKLA